MQVILITNVYFNLNSLTFQLQNDFRTVKENKTILIAEAGHETLPFIVKTEFFKACSKPGALNFY